MVKDSPIILPLYLWILLGAVLLAQSIWLFRDAQKHSAYPWLWGLWGLIKFPTPLVVYLIVVRKIFKKRK
jgi:hypothetical protein